MGREEAEEAEEAKEAEDKKNNGVILSGAKDLLWLFRDEDEQQVLRSAQDDTV